MILLRIHGHLIILQRSNAPDESRLTLGGNAA